MIDKLHELAERWIAKADGLPVLSPVGITSRRDAVELLATLRQQAAQPDDSRCPPTYRREEAVKVLIGMGWSWDGKQWNAPVLQAARVDEAMVFRAMRAWGEAPPHGDINRMRAALEAALSAQPAPRCDKPGCNCAAWKPEGCAWDDVQPAERQGEAVARYREFAAFYALLKKTFDERFPMCRDCADEDGTCPDSGLPCEWPKLPAFTLVTHPAAPVGVPDGLLDHLHEAARRMENGHAPRRIPAEPGDVDLALAEVIAWLEGRPAPFWTKPKAATSAPRGEG